MALKELTDFFKLPFYRTPIRSYYCRFLLPLDHWAVYEVILDNVITINSRHYDGGLLIANLKRETILEKVGYQISLSRLKKILKRLEDLGLVIIVHRNYSNSLYIVGLRHADGQNRSYFLYGMVMKFEDAICENIENQIKKGKRPKITDINPYCMNQDLKDFIKSNYEMPYVITEKLLDNGKTFYNTVFRSEEAYRKPLPRVI